MKIIGMTAAILGLAFAGCRKTAVDVAPPPTPEPVAVAAPPPRTPPVVNATPPSTAVPVVVAASPTPHLAPEGVFYLVSRVRIETNDGIVALAPGTGVRRVREGVYLTPSGEMTLSPKQLTNDLDIARRARDSDRASQIAATQQPTTASNQAPLTEAIALFNAYTANEIAADTRFKGKNVLVTGVIDRIGKDILGNGFIVLHASDMFGVQCSFSDTHSAEIGTMSIGQTVAVTGIVSGKMGNVVLTECAQVKR